MPFLRVWWILEERKAVQETCTWKKCLVMTGATEPGCGRRWAELITLALFDFIGNLRSAIRTSFLSSLRCPILHWVSVPSLSGVRVYSTTPHLSGIYDLLKSRSLPKAAWAWEWGVIVGLEVVVNQNASRVRHYLLILWSYCRGVLETVGTCTFFSPYRRMSSERWRWRDSSSKLLGLWLI